jgi:hypothetical protein
VMAGIAVAIVSLLAVPQLARLRPLIANLL